MDIQLEAGWGLSDTFPNTRDSVAVTASIGSQMSWDQTLRLPRTSCVVLWKLLSLSDENKPT